MRAIITHNEERTFLPALRSSWWLQYQECGTTLASRATPSLTKLYYFVSHNSVGEPRHTEEVMKLLPSCFPSLHTFVFIQPMPRDLKDAHDLHTPSLLSMKQLRSLRIDSNLCALHYSILRRIFKAMHLEEIDFWLADLTQYTCTSPILAPDLQTLKCRGPVTDVIALLPELRAPALAAFEFESYFFDATPDHMLRLCRMLSEPPFSRTLKSVSLIMPAPFEEPEDLETVDLISDILHPLLSLTQLESLSFKYPREMYHVVAKTTDEEIARLGRALPNLRFLRLFDNSPDTADYPGEDSDSDSDDEEASSPSCASLVHLAQHCPRLEELHLQYIDVDFDEFTVPESAPTASHPLRLLAIRSLEVEAGNEEGAFVQLLDRLFPNLRVAWPTDVLPESLQPDEDSSVVHWEPAKWGRWKAGGPGARNVYVQAYW